MRNLIYIFLFVFCVVATACSTATNPVQVSNENAVAAWSKIKAGAILVDVRSPEEFESGHLKGAINIPMNEIQSRIEELGDDMEKEIVLYCRSGRRAGMAAGTLEASGFSNVLNAGGYQDLLNSAPSS